MTVYVPDVWKLVKFTKDGTYKVLAGWKGGYTVGDSWRLSSHTIKIEEQAGYYVFHQHSGSVYMCSKTREGYTMLSKSVFTALAANLEEANVVMAMKDLT